MNVKTRIPTNARSKMAFKKKKKDAILTDEMNEDVLKMLKNFNL